MEKAYAMFFIVRGSKGEDVAAAVRLRAVNAVAKARDLGFLGWQVFIECGDGNRYYPGEFDRLLSHLRYEAPPIVPPAEPPNVRDKALPDSFAGNAAC